MDILFLARAVDVVSGFGDAVHVRELVSAWVRDGHRVDLICSGSRGAEVASGLRELWGPSARTHFLGNAGLSRFYYARGILAVWRSLLAAKSRPPGVLYARPGAGLSGTFDAFPEVFVSRLARIPLFLEINGWAEDESSELRQSRMFQFRGVSNKIVRKVFELVHGFVAVSAGLAERLSANLAVDANRIRVIPNGANPDLFRPVDSADARARTGLPPKVPILIYVGHLGLECDLDPVLRALPMLKDDFPGILLVVVGDGPEEERYRSLADAAGCHEMVRWAGAVQHERVPLFVNASDLGLVAVKPRLSGNPVKLFEYWACAKPVVAAPAESLHLVKEIGGGVVAASQTPEAWSEAISQMLGSTERLRECGSRGRDYVLRERTWTATARAVQAFMEDVVLTSVTN